MSLKTPAQVAALQHSGWSRAWGAAKTGAAMGWGATKAIGRATKATASAAHDVACYTKVRDAVAPLHARIAELTAQLEAVQKGAQQTIDQLNARLRAAAVQQLRNTTSGQLTKE